MHCAQLELKLEEKFFSIEEEWSEQNLSFQHYKSHGPVLLEASHTHSLLEQLEHAQMELATMLTSKYIQPLKEEAIQWAAKLASISDILQQVRGCSSPTLPRCYFFAYTEFRGFLSKTICS